MEAIQEPYGRAEGVTVGDTNHFFHGLRSKINLVHQARLKVTQAIVSLGDMDASWGMAMLDDKGFSTPARIPETNAADIQERRTADRHIAVFRVGKLISASGQEFCLIRNISDGGLMANVYSPHAVGESIAIELKASSIVAGHIVWARDNKIGVAFEERIDVTSILAGHAGDTADDFHPRLPRIEIRCAARLRVGARYQRVEICDIAQGGAKIAGVENIVAGDEVVLSIDGLPPQQGTVRWQSEDKAGIAFNTAIPFGQIAAWATKHD